MTDDLKPRAKFECRWDLVSLGEVMLRLDPGDTRIHTARNFRVWEGGGEYNVARGLKRCFRLESAIVTALVDNAVGRLVQDLIYQAGVDQSHVHWVESDGVGRVRRNGLNFTERGFGIRAALGCSDRGIQLSPSYIQAKSIGSESLLPRVLAGFIQVAFSRRFPKRLRLLPKKQCKPLKRVAQWSLTI